MEWLRVGVILNWESLVEEDWVVGINNVSINDIRYAEWYHLEDSVDPQ